jgi:hypothetical protein
MLFCNSCELHVEIIPIKPKLLSSTLKNLRIMPESICLVNFCNKNPNQENLSQLFLYCTNLRY